jgi:hypothetical protein
VERSYRQTPNEIELSYRWQERAWIGFHPEINVNVCELLPIARKKLRIPKSVAVRLFTLVSNEGFVPLCKKLFDVKTALVLTIGPTPFQILLSTNIIIERTAKYEIVSQ